MSSQQAVKTQITDQVMLITLNRPESLNAISASLVEGCTPSAPVGQFKVIAQESLFVHR